MTSFGLAAGNSWHSFDALADWTVAESVGVAGFVQDFGKHFADFVVDSRLVEVAAGSIPADLTADSSLVVEAIDSKHPVLGVGSPLVGREELLDCPVYATDC